MECQRDLFSLPPDVHYLNCAYMSPQLKSVEAAGVEALRRKNDPSGILVADFFTPVETLRGLVGKLVNAPPERVAFIPAVSYGVALAAANTPLSAGRNVVFPAEEFPSNVYAWRERCKETGAELRMVPRPSDSQHPGAKWNEAILEAIDGQTALVTLTVVHWTDGTLFDVQRVADRAAEVGALFVIDGTQSVGARSFDFQAIQPDMLICAGYKWCLGPYSYGFAVLGDRMMEGRALEQAWIHREGCEDFAQLIHYTDGLRQGGRRFDVGESSNFIMVPMLTAALEQIQAWGVENIRDYCAGLVGEVGTALAESEFALAPTEEHGAHLFGIHVPDEGRVPRIMEELQRRKIYVSLRGTSIRVAPHVYNHSDNMAALAEALLASRA